MPADGHSVEPVPLFARRAETSASDSAPQRSTHQPQTPEIPDHELLCLIGRGSYGEVWLARNAIGTLRAVKIVHRPNFDKSEHFERELKAATR